MTRQHLTADDLSAALDGELSQPAQAHLADCRVCHARLASEAAIEQAAHHWAAVHSMLELAEVSEIRRLPTRALRPKPWQALVRESALAVACALALSAAGWRSVQSPAPPMKDVVASGCVRMQAWCR